MEQDLANTSIAIVGAGPAGLVMALALASKGVRSVVVGPTSSSPDSRTTALLHGTVRILDRMGAWKGLEVDATPLRRLAIVDATSRWLRAPPLLFDASELNLEAFGWNVTNRQLIAKLEAAISQTHLVSRIEDHVDRIESSHGEVRLALRKQNDVRTALAIGADGRNSLARRAASISVTEWDYPQAALTVILRHTAPHHETSFEYQTESGPFTLVPLAENRSGLVCVVHRTDVERLNQLSDSDLALDLEKRCQSHLGRFEIEGSRSIWPLGAMVAKTMADRRVALIGEAAHTLPPIGAQGFNLTVRDVEALAECVYGTADPGSPMTLEAYARKREADVWLRSRSMDLLNRSLLSSFFPVQLARMVGFALLERVRPFRRLVMQAGLGPNAPGPRSLGPTSVGLGSVE